MQITLARRALQVQRSPVERIRMANHPRSLRRGRHPAAVATVAGLHAIVGYALVTSMAQRAAEPPRPPVDTRIVEEPQRPPPPLPQPEVVPVQLAPPPPAYVPPPEVIIKRPPPPKPVITTTRVAPPPAPVIVPSKPAPAPAPVARAPVRAPAPPPRRLAKPARIHMAGCSKPDYPRAALRAGATGTTRIEFAIDASGQVKQATLVEPSGRSVAHRRMDRAAIEALSRCAFQPGLDETGKPMGARAVVEYVWRLDD